MKKFSLKVKLGLGFASCLVLVTLVGGAGYYTLSKSIHSFTLLSDESFPKTIALDDNRVSQKSMVIAVSLLLNHHATHDEIQAQKKVFDAAYADYQNSRARYLKLPLAEEEKRMWAEVDQTFAPFKSMIEQLFELAETGTPESEKLRDRLGENDFQTIRQPIIKSFKALSAYQMKEAERTRSQTIGDAVIAQRILIAMIFIGTTLAAVFGFAISKSLSSDLNRIIQRLSENSVQLATAATEVSSASDGISLSSTQQAASLQETSSAVEEINATIKKNSETASESCKIAQNSSEIAKKGQSVITQMISAISEIERSSEGTMGRVEHSNQEIAKTVSLIEEIRNKTVVINDIVFQTKLLSFNASVEAARAGEHGKGFAVVAEEVGNLAQMSGKAASEISQLLERSIETVQQIVAQTTAEVNQAIAENKERISQGTAIGQECGEVLADIVKNVETVVSMVENIAASSNQQSTAMTEISKAVGELDQATSQNSTISKAASDSAVALSEQANTLKSMVKSLVEVVTGSDTGAAA